VGVTAGADGAGGREGSFDQCLIFGREPEQLSAGLIVCYLAGESPVAGSPLPRLFYCHALENVGTSIKVEGTAAHAGKLGSSCVSPAR